MQFLLHEKREQHSEVLLSISLILQVICLKNGWSYAHLHILHLQTNLVSQIVISVWYSLGEKLFLHSIIYFLFIFCRNKFSLGPQKPPSSHALAILFFIEFFFRFTFYHPKNIGNLYPSRSQVATVYSLVSQRYLSLV